MLYLNIWLFAGLVTYLRILYVDEFKSNNTTYKFKESTHKLIVFIISIFLGLFGLILLLIMDIYLFYIFVSNKFKNI